MFDTTGTPPEAVMVAIEVPHGPIVESLMERGFRVHAIDPKQLDRFRDRFSLSDGIRSRAPSPIIVAAARKPVSLTAHNDPVGRRQGVKHVETFGREATSLLFGDALLDALEVLREIHAKCPRKFPAHPPTAFRAGSALAHTRQPFGVGRE